MKKKDIIFIIGLCIVIGIMYLVYELTQKEKNGEIEKAESFRRNGSVFVWDFGILVTSGW